MGLQTSKLILAGKFRHETLHSLRSVRTPAKNSDQRCAETVATACLGGEKSVVSAKLQWTITCDCTPAAHCYENNSKHLAYVTNVQFPRKLILMQLLLVFLNYKQSHFTKLHLQNIFLV